MLRVEMRGSASRTAGSGLRPPAVPPESRPGRSLASSASITTTGTALAEEIVQLGGEGIRNCYQCGTCTAVCPLSESSSANFRKTIKYVQLGLKQKLLGDMTPWLCYYCGDCQASCPRNANPSEIMAAVRRYQTGKYDWTGFSAHLIRSRTVEVVSIVSLALLTGLVVLLFHGPIVTGSVQLETFAPLSIVEPVGLGVFAVLALILMSNTFRMYRYTKLGPMAGDSAPQQRGLLTSLKKLVTVLGVYFITQFPMKECGARRRWVDHLLIFTGYAVSFLLFVVLLRYTLTNQFYSFSDPLLLAGYFASLALLYGTTISLVRRLRGSDTYSKSARHSTDWMFILLLFFTALTGLLVNVFKYLSLPLPTYYIFAIHLSFVVPLLVLEVPFAKWSHLAYRPFAAFFTAWNGMKVPRFRGERVA